MSDEVEIIVLGCGNSSGIPSIGNYWGQCDPGEPRNQRFRASIAVKSAQTTLVIDTGPDFKHQMNRENMDNLDAVLYTHAHNDHVMGIDELRVLKFRHKKDFIPIYCDGETLDELERRFDYLFKGGNHTIYPPVLQAQMFHDTMYGNVQAVGDISFIPFQQDHGSCTSIGYRFGDFAYSVDILDLDDKAIDVLKGVDTWLVDCAAYKDNDNPVHAGLDKIFELNERIRANHVFLTSMSLLMDYQTLCDELPSGYYPAFDGMRLKVKL